MVQVEDMMAELEVLQKTLREGIGTSPFYHLHIFAQSKKTRWKRMLWFQPSECLLEFIHGVG